MNSEAALTRRGALAAAATLAAGSVGAAPPVAEGPFRQRGYYLLFTRAPTLGLAAWRQTIDAVRADGGNMVLLWTAGAFRSRKFPVTYQHNADHENVRADFVRALIAHAHDKGVRVVLGFTPFGYDGVNRYCRVRPDLVATGPDGKPVTPYGIFCWGQNLCPAKDDAQRFMLDYVREMYFELYPDADGLIVESSDYAVCHCKDCGAKYFDHEFRFVRQISDEVWRHKPDADILVYPHYFTGAKVPFAEVRAAKQPFDPRWTLFFTGHSAKPDPALIRQSRASIWWTEGPALGTPGAIRDAARFARHFGATGYVPSLEAYSYVATQPEEGETYMVGRRQVPLGFGWVPQGQCPYFEVPAVVNRVAYREWTRDPDLPFDEYKKRLGRELFGDAATPAAVEDALTLQAVLATERSWSQVSPLADVERVRAMSKAGKLDAAKRAGYRAALERVRGVETRARQGGAAMRPMYTAAKWLSDQWRGENAGLLEGAR